MYIYYQVIERMSNKKETGYISTKLDEVSLAIDVFNLWVEKAASENNINMELLQTEKEKLKM